MLRIKLLVFATAFTVACAGGAGTNSPAADSTSGNSNSPGANAGGGASPAPPAQMVRVEAAGVDARRGAGAEGVVRLTVAEGYHVNANPASEKYLIPTELKFEPAAGIEIGGLTYPDSVTRQFSFSEKPLAVYEGEVRIRFALRARPDATAGEHTLRARLRYQACDDAQCYPPRTADAAVTVRVN